MVIFNHLDGKLEGPTPTVLELRDGDVFALIFCDTAPTLFDYEITAIEPKKEGKTPFQSGPGSAQVDEGDLTSTSLSWKHQEGFSLYKVSVTLRAGEQNPQVTTAEYQQELKQRIDRMPQDEKTLLMESYNQDDSTIGQFLNENPGILADLLTEMGQQVPEPIYLYSYTFPVWVKTISWTLSFTSGVAFSDLTNDEFFIETDTKGTDTTDDDTKLVRRDRDASGASRPDLVLFANLLTPDARESNLGDFGGNLGLAFGLGLNGDGDPRYYFGPSWTIGRKNHFVLMAGWTGGQVDRLPSGQAVDAPPISDNVLSSLDSSFEHGFFVGLTFSFNAKKEEDFTKALTGKAARTDDGNKPST